MKKLITMLTIILLVMPSVLATGYCDWWWCYKGGSDWDFIPRHIDNCPDNFNPSQRDADDDTIGDACDSNPDDKDWDSTSDSEDNCILYNPSQRDADDDTIGDMCDVNLRDWDWDGVINWDDNCPLFYNPKQIDDDKDGRGNPCDCAWFYFWRFCE